MFSYEPCTDIVGLQVRRDYITSCSDVICDVNNSNILIQPYLLHVDQLLHQLVMI